LPGTAGVLGAVVVGVLVVPGVMPGFATLPLLAPPLLLLLLAGVLLLCPFQSGVSPLAA
jgi:hypothetical protein